MPKKPTDLAKDVRGDSDTFTKFARRLMQVPHSEIKAALDAKKEINRRSKASVSRVPRVSSKREN
jgi:hypothetical protein